MSDKKYCETMIFPRQHDVMWDLFMKGVNYDSHAWVRYVDVERAVAEILEIERAETGRN